MIELVLAAGVCFALGDTSDLRIRARYQGRWPKWEEAGPWDRAEGILSVLLFIAGCAFLLAFLVRVLIVAA